MPAGAARRVPPAEARAGVGGYGDPDALEAAARRLAADAQGLRDRARAVRRSAASMCWQGPAASAFRRALDDDLDVMHRAAGELEQAAAAMREHAAQVRERLERIRALEHAVTGWFDRRLRSLQDDPPWSGWTWRPGSLPAPGDLAWLDVGADLHRRGVAL